MDDKASRRKNAWTKEQDKTIVELRGKLLPWSAIAERTGRTVESCTARYRNLLPPEARTRGKGSSLWTEAELETLKNLVAEHKKTAAIAAILNKKTKVVQARIDYMRQPIRARMDASSRLVVPPSRLADRDRRMAAERNVTAEFFGDPRPGQSALDRREQRA